MALRKYVIGDTVVFTSTSPFRIKITGRTKHYINAFGEELMINNVDCALAYACKETNSSISDFTGAPIFMKENESGAHEWIFEFSTPPENLEQFIDLFDNQLKALNSDYEAKRYNGITLKRPVVHIAKPHLFYRWLEAKGKLGGQNKVPRLSNDREYIEPLLTLNRE